VKSPRGLELGPSSASLLCILVVQRKEESGDGLGQAGRALLPGCQVVPKEGLGVGNACHVAACAWIPDLADDYVSSRIPHLAGGVEDRIQLGLEEVLVELARVIVTVLLALHETKSRGMLGFSWVVIMG
jgi:hypothetical protein